MEYFYEYLLFLAQAVTVLVVVLIIVSAIVNASGRREDTEKGYLRIADLNQRLEGYQETLQYELLDKAELKVLAKQQKQDDKRAAKVAAKAAKAAAADEGDERAASRLFVLDFNGDLQASRVEHLRKEITAVLTMAKAQDEVVLRLESPGGVVHGYGLAASQLHRIKNAGVPLTVLVDKVAASGGYMMAAVADKIVAAPFAVMGSIGVVAQVPNVHRLLKNYDVDVDVLTAGKHKRTLTMLGENTAEGREKFQQELEDTHQLFQTHIVEYRPNLDMSVVATGETWYGQEALALNLVDEISTSDSYLVSACEQAKVFQVSWVEQHKPLDRILGRLSQMSKSLEALWMRWA